MAIPMFSGKFFTDVYANLTWRFLHPEIPRWRTYTGSSYSIVTEYNNKVILAAGALLYVCIATEIVSISVSVANLLVLPVLGTVSTSGLRLMLLSEVGQCMYQWKWIGLALKTHKQNWNFENWNNKRVILCLSSVAMSLFPINKTGDKIANVNAKT